MRIKARLLRFSVFGDGDISLQFGALQGGNGQDVLSSLKEIKGEKRKVTIGDFYIYGTIKSIRVSKDTSILIKKAKTPGSKYVINRLSELVYSENSGKKDLSLLMNTRQEEELQHLLEKASALLGEPSEALLVRLSTYSHGGKVVPGEKSVYQLSPRRQEVVISKLKDEIREKAGSHCSGN